MVYLLLLLPELSLHCNKLCLLLQLQCEPVLSTRYAFEEQLSKLYTRAVFTLFKETLFDSTAFLVNEVSNAMGAYVVTHGKTSRKNPWSQHAFQVTADVESGLYECECKTWIHTGVLLGLDLLLQMFSPVTVAILSVIAAILSVTIVILTVTAIILCYCNFHSQLLQIALSVTAVILCYFCYIPCYCNFHSLLLQLLCTILLQVFSAHIL